MLRSPLFAPFVLVSLAPLLSSQVGQPGTPATERYDLPGPVPLVYLAPPDVDLYQNEDATTYEASGGSRYGVVVETDVSLAEHGRWDQVEETGELVWRVEIVSPGAFSLGVLFGEYDLPPGGELFLYRPDREQVLGAFTDALVQENRMLGIQPLRGDRVVLEYVQSVETSGSPALRVESVTYDFRDLYGRFGGSMADNGCLIDVNCPQGAPYQDIKRSIVALFVGGFACTGAILNNTAYDGTPYLLTAEHCGDYTNATFVFNYERPNCGSGIAPLSDSVSGAQRLAKDSFLDSQLYRLNQVPPASFNVFYAGWGRGSAPPAPTVGISHPAGLPKKLHIDFDEPQDFGSVWSAVWDQGEIQWGSSGSPLFAANKRILGPLSTGQGNCALQTVGYGQFRKFYRRDNLERWLDPLGLEPVGIAGYDPAAATAVPYNGSNVNGMLYTTTSPPALGATWSAEVDVSGHPGAVSTIVQAHAAPASGQLFSWGELLIDLSSPRAFRSTAGVSGGLSTHSGLIPNDPGLAGAVAYSQAFLLGGGLEAANGVELRVF